MSGRRFADDLKLRTYCDGLCRDGVAVHRCRVKGGLSTGRARGRGEDASGGLSQRYEVSVEPHGPSEVEADRLRLRDRDHGAL